MEQPILILLPVVLLLYVTYLAFKKIYLPRISGSIGEYYVTRTLKRLDKKDYTVHNDLYLIKNGKTTQIDHLVISIYGIFVIETKNYKGWIFGKEKSKYWTQTLYQKKFKLFNPIIQNWGHVNFIKSLNPDLKSYYYIPIVVFAGKAKLKKVESSIPVIYRRKLLKTIRKKKEVVLTHTQMARISGSILNHSASKKEIKKQHRQQVKSSIKRDKQNTNIKSCPKCGGKLVEKLGKYGSFLGCTNYPNCKFTKNISN